MGASHTVCRAAVSSWQAGTQRGTAHPAGTGHLPPPPQQPYQHHRAHPCRLMLCAEGDVWRPVNVYSLQKREAGGQAMKTAWLSVVPPLPLQSTAEQSTAHAEPRGPYLQFAAALLLDGADQPHDALRLLDADRGFLQFRHLRAQRCFGPPQLHRAHLPRPQRSAPLTIVPCRAGAAQPRGGAAWLFGLRPAQRLLVPGRPRGCVSFAARSGGGKRKIKKTKKAKRRGGSRWQPLPQPSTATALLNGTKRQPTAGQRPPGTAPRSRAPPRGDASSPRAPKGSEGLRKAPKCSESLRRVPKGSESLRRAPKVSEPALLAHRAACRCSFVRRPAPVGAVRAPCRH